MPTGPAVAEIGAEAFAAALPDLLAIYAEAMGYEARTAAARGPLWLEHAQRPGFRCVVATAPTPADALPPTGVAEVVGFSYGYRGMPGQWWCSEVARGLGEPTPAALAHYFELTELHVRPAWQGAGIGEALLRALLQPVTERDVLLSTPEGENRAWRLYRRTGFGDVLRQFLFRGDARPFAVLGRPLPLSDPEERPRHGAG